MLESYFCEIKLENSMDILTFCCFLIFRGHIHILIKENYKCIKFNRELLKKILKKSIYV